MRLVKLKQSFKDAETKVVEYYQLYVVFDNGYRIPIKPTYKDDKRALLSIAEVE